MVELTPLHWAETPMSAKNIVNRINEVASINGLISELRALDTVNRNVADADIRMHVLSMSERPAAPIANEPSIKRTVGRVLFEMLRQDGYQAFDNWLDAHGALLGNQSSANIGARYLSAYAMGPAALAYEAA